MNHRTKSKLRGFLNDEMWGALTKQEADKNYLNLSYIKEELGFDNESIYDNSRYGAGYKFTNGKGCSCILRFEKKTSQIFIQIAVDDFSSSHHRTTIGTLYNCINDLDRIAGEFRQFKDNLEKQEKINEISKNSINTWIKTIMESQAYSYCTTESENKITLSIRIKNHLQLDIPIYYNKFQSIMPELPETIKQFEKTIIKSKINLLISTGKRDQQWITPNSRQR